MAQAILHQREKFGIVPRFRIENAVRIDAGLVKAGREQVPRSHRPQDRPLGTRNDSSDE